MADDDGAFKLREPTLGYQPPPIRLAPDLQLTPPAAPSVLGPGGGSLPSLINAYGHYADPPPAAFNPLAPLPTPAPAAPGIPGLDGLGTRPGLQLDEDGIGTTAGDWRLRFMPIIPGFNEP